ncbi:serine/threonine-protein kinase [Botrimarina hoheduenensis]|uniref:non-specific serine/threonine protein kinase n=1 Tax=Botrimarina hoheduenensis TaxID=2528000 RepID=A0A5C5VV00_9BACT|nr:serine/threonine-protein kinase [Botrimarina hoheduenensis]TWT42468.1 Serine/threonine-protein kinase PknB [Botrimarina hoheduenensis]
MDLTGKQLNDFRLLRLIGRGAMATVYLAEQQSLARRVAIKVLNPDLAGDARQVARFQQEARAAASMTHPAIVQVYEVGSVGEHYYLAQEYVPGGSLGDLLRRQGRLAPGAVLGVMWQVAQGLAAAAERGLVHRDIKPDNLMLDRTGAVKVADFGLARLAEAGTNMTREGVALGTPLYMSPEQVEARPIDARSDLYSLGVTAFHLLTGDPPFVGDSPLAVAMQHVGSPPPTVCERDPEAPPALAQVIDKLLQKSPDQRYLSPEALLAALAETVSHAERDGWSESSAAGLTNTLARAATVTRELGVERERLSAAMRRERRTGRYARWMIAAAVLGGAILGGLLRPQPLLPQPGAPEVARADSAKAQLLIAKRVDTPDAWRAVARYHPEADRFFLLLATRGLAACLLERDAPQAAEFELRRLGAEGATSPEFAVFSQAGLAIAYAQAGRDDDARTALERFDSLGEKAPAQLAEELARVRSKLAERG